MSTATEERPTPWAAEESGTPGLQRIRKQWRGLAARYDKLAAVYRGCVVLRAITILLRE